MNQQQDNNNEDVEMNLNTSTQSSLSYNALRNVVKHNEKFQIAKDLKDKTTNVSESQQFDYQMVIEREKLEKDNKRFYLILHDVAKRMNIGMIIRSAVAFGIKEIFIAVRGDRKKSYTHFGSQGTINYVKFREFKSLDAIQEHCKFMNIHICGVEIKDDAIPLTHSNQNNCFFGHTAFMMGNEGHGINKRFFKYIDYFLYIPHYDNGTASLNVSIAFSIVVHHFADWAKYKEQERKDDKYVVTKIDKKNRPLEPYELKKRQDRKRAREEKEMNLTNTTEISSSSTNLTHKKI